MIIILLFGPGILLFLIGLILNRKNSKKAKIFFILAGVYLLISLGTCGIMMANFKLH